MGELPLLGLFKLGFYRAGTSKNPWKRYLKWLKTNGVPPFLKKVDKNLKKMFDNPKGPAYKADLRSAEMLEKPSKTALRRPKKN